MIFLVIFARQAKIIIVDRSQEKRKRNALWATQTQKANG